MKILVIESDRAAADMIRDVLARCHLVFEADPHYALASVIGAAEAGEPYNLVLCGFVQPGEPGFRLLAAMRELREPPVCTLISTYRDVVEAAMFADYVLIKPLVRSEVEDIVARVWSNAATRKLRAHRVA